MNFSFAGLMGSLLVSGVGFVFFTYGRKKSRFWFLIIGIIMMIYPYFITDFLPMVGLAVLMCSLLYWLNKQGY